MPEGETKDRVRARVLVSGRVQGVFFRDSTRGEAEVRGLSGWVRNLPDGRVEALFEGEESKIREMVEWCAEGPPEAAVEGIDVEYEQAEGSTRRFEVR